MFALLAIVLPDRFSSAQTDEIRVGQPTTVPLPSGARVEVYGGSGYILLKKATTADVVVSVVKSKLAADVPVTMLKTPEGITICTVYPAQDAKKPHECVPGGKGRLYEGNPQKLPDIGITVELPDGMAAAASIGAGEVRSNSVTGDVSLFSDRGTVTVNDGGVGHIRGQCRSARQHSGESGPWRATPRRAPQFAWQRPRARGDAHGSVRAVQHRHAVGAAHRSCVRHHGEEGLSRGFDQPAGD